MIRNSIALFAALLTGGFVTLASAQDSSEPDCPEDSDTSPGCEIEDAEESERQPVEGAATAPVEETGTAEEDAKTMTGPDSEGAEGSSEDGSGESDGGS